MCWPPQRTWQRVLRGVVLAFAVFLAGCVYLPETKSAYNAECGLTERHMTLGMHQVAAFRSCHNEGCVAILALAGVVTAASAVISGSVVVVGNVVFWLEKQGACLSTKNKP